MMCCMTKCIRKSRRIMKGVFEKPRKQKGGNCRKASIRKCHKDYIRELRAPFKSQEDKEKQNRASDNGSTVKTIYRIKRIIIRKGILRSCQRRTRIPIEK